ncbi:MAG: efflux RND transporter periplasmic adaptor subunit [Jannaschia sp.]
MLSIVRPCAALCCAFLWAGSVGAQDATGTPLPRVTVEEVVVQPVEARVSISGTLVPREEVLVSSQTNGFPIEALLHDVGDWVDRGEVMARVDDRTLKAQLLQAEAEAARAESALRQASSQIDSAEATAAESDRALDRARRLLSSGTTTQALLDQAIAADLTAQATVEAARDGSAVAQAQVQQAEAARDIAALNLENAVIRAPVSGVVSERAGQVGALAGTTGEPLFRIIAGGDVEVEAEVIETELGSVEVGQPARVTVAGLGDVAGEVRRISPTVDAATRLGKVRITLASDDLRPGLFSSGWIVTTTRNAATVPVSAVLSDAAGDHVLVVVDDVLERRDVVAGLVAGNRREIVTGLSDGDLVVSRAAAFFAAGDRVAPMLAQEASE